MTLGPYEGWHIHSDRASRRAGVQYRGLVRGIDLDGRKHDYALLVDHRGEKAPLGFTRVDRVGDDWPPITSAAQEYRTVTRVERPEMDLLDEEMLAPADARGVNAVRFLWLGLTLISYRLFYDAALVGVGVTVRVTATGEVRPHHFAERFVEGGVSSRREPRTSKPLTPSQPDCAFGGVRREG